MNAGSERFVLAGGESSRMGQDKALLTLQGVPLLALALQKLRPLAGPPPRIAGARADLSRFAPVVPDLSPGCGPLSGIEAALAATTRPLNLLLAVDLPLVPAAFLAWMLARARLTGALMTVPRSLGRPQPLCAVYHRDLRSPVAAALKAGNYKVMPALRAAAGRAGECDLFDLEQVAAAQPQLTASTPVPLYRWFHNCNTPEDMAAIGNALVLSA